MITATPLTPENADRIAALYEAFCIRAKSDYQWTHPPIDLDMLKQALATRMLRGYIAEDGGEPVSFMLFTLEEHRAIEINIIYIPEGKEIKTITDRFMRHLIADHRDEEGWDVVSYAMLGEQAKLVRTILWYGFKPVGQSIVSHNMMDPISIQLLRGLQLPPLPDGYSLQPWAPEHAGAVSDLVYEAFSRASDSLWDPRFRTQLGARRVVGSITSGLFGRHLPSCTGLLMKGDQPVGFCFMVEPMPMQGNIPLIGLHPDEKGKGLGTHLLKFSLDRCVDEIIGGRLFMMGINATMDTDNLAAIRMYRRVGFKEDHNYPHVYLTREKAQAYVPGKWC